MPDIPESAPPVTGPPYQTLHDVMSANADLRAENERLRAECDCDTYAKALDEKIQENERLRAVANAAFAYVDRHSKVGLYELWTALVVACDKYRGFGND